jgi:hypothetical protein
MDIIFTLTPTEKNNFRCEVWNCKNSSDYFVDDFDGETGYVCKSCFVELKSRKGESITMNLSEIAKLCEQDDSLVFVRSSGTTLAREIKYRFSVGRMYDAYDTNREYKITPQMLVEQYEICNTFDPTQVKPWKGCVATTELAEDEVKRIRLEFGERKQDSDYEGQCVEEQKFKLIDDQASAEFDNFWSNLPKEDKEYKMKNCMSFGYTNGYTKAWNTMNEKLWSQQAENEKLINKYLHDIEVLKQEIETNRLRYLDIARHSDEQQQTAYNDLENTYSKELNRYKEEIDSYEAAISELETENNRLKSTCSEKEVKRLTSIIEKLQTVNTRLQDKLKLEKSNRGYKEEILNSFEDEIAKLVAENNKLRSNTLTVPEAMQDLYSAADATVKHLRNENTELKEIIEAARKTIYCYEQLPLNKVASEWEKRYTDLYEVYLDQKKQIDNYKNRCANLNGKLIAQRFKERGGIWEKYTEMDFHKNLDNIQQTESIAKVEGLREDLSRARNLITELNSQVNMLNDALCEIGKYAATVVHKHNNKES